MPTLEAGQPAPAFSLPRDGGGTLDLADYAGRIVVVFFYPKDDTSGCTKEAIGFTERMADFEAAGAAVIGISKDSVKSHDKFKAKHELAMPLLSDEDGSVCDQFGVWVEKSMYGRKYMGIERSTFLIDGTGTLRQVWRKVKVPGHVDAVLAAVREISG
ncbi:thioredoxin-dependent thiol peroxidase [Rhodobacteraceae bacterium DSL-40]|uniref:thioredoxin-dependent thiol peroxidase n=1 Tax=Amaricoccus sp. B4 TaxID=3368557 RepID=UPI000DAC560F